MFEICEKCGRTYDDAECWVTCPHKPISWDTAYEQIEPRPRGDASTLLLILLLIVLFAIGGMLGLSAFGQPPPATQPTTRPTTLQTGVDNFGLAKLRLQAAAGSLDAATADYIAVSHERDAALEEVYRLTHPPPVVVLPPPPVHFVKGLNLGPHSEAQAAQPFQNLFRGFSGGGSDRTSVGWGLPDKPWAPNPALRLTDRGYPLVDAGAYSYLWGAADGLYEFRGEGAFTVSFGGKLRDITAPTTQPATRPATTERLVKLDRSLGSMGMIVVRGFDPADPPRNFRLTPKGQDPNRVWSPGWAGRLHDTGAAHLRPMDFDLTNRKRPHQWADRLRADDWRQVGPWGVSPELLATLPRETGCGLWINVPDFYTDESIAAMAEFYRSALPAGGELWVELLSNELWNPDWDSSQRVRAAARAAGVQFHEQYARECVRAARAWRDGWRRGATDVRLHLVLPCQTASPSLTTEVFKAIRRQNGGQGARDVGFTHVAVSGYYSYPESVDLELEALEQAGRPDAAVDLYFARLNADTAVPQDRRLKQKAAWQAEGLLPAVYEGGHGATFWNGLLRRDAAAATKRVARNDPRMGAFVGTAMAAAERDYGPLPPDTPFCWFSFCDRDSWGILADIEQPATPMLEAFSRYPG